MQHRLYERHLKAVVEELLRAFRIVYLSGPRQSGKTTLVRQVGSNLGMRYFSLDDQALLRAVCSDPQGFIRGTEGQPIVLDEFQYVPELIPAIKAASDNLAVGEKGRFLLTGSADIFRSARTQEALPGHMARLELYPLSIAEISSLRRNLVDDLIAGDFSSACKPSWSREKIAERILLGGYPEAQRMSTRARGIWFRSYLEGRLFKDFESLYSARGDYYSKLRALTPYLAGLSSNLLKYSTLAKDLQIDDRLARRYIDILELLYIIKRLPAYRKNRAKRIATGMPKLHLVDTGLACYLLQLDSTDQLLRSGHYGHLLESLVFLELLKHTMHTSHSCELFHFRDTNQREIDLVLEHSGSRIIGIEVKASSTLRAGDFRHLSRLADLAGNDFDRGILIYTGDEVLPFRFGQHKFLALPISMLGKL